MLAFDRYALAVQDLDEAGSRLFEELGLASVPGGRHAGHGTGNRIVPLGRDYLELIAVVDPDEAKDSSLGKRIASLTEDGDRPFALCLRAPALDEVARRLDLVTTQMSRRPPGGDELSWRLAGLEVALADDPLPFFIEWDSPPETHPGRAAVSHRREPDGIAWVEWAGEHDRLADWLGEHRLDIRPVSGRPGPGRLAIAVEGGEIIV